MSIKKSMENSGATANPGLPGPTCDLILILKLPQLPQFFAG